MRVFFSVGEPSGDTHAANLIRDLRARRPQLECVGLGGPQMESAGCRLEYPLVSQAVMGIVRVVTRAPLFLRLLRSVDRYFSEHHVDAVVLVDFPGFNWWVARCARKHRIPVIYYGAPQLWAWAPWRLGKMRRLVQLVLCKLPFEADWYRQRGCRAEYVGHPFFDQVQRQSIDREFMDSYDGPEPLVVILPGSRDQEIELNLATLIDTARHIHRARPDTRFADACLREEHAAAAREALRGRTLPADVFAGRTAELIRMAHSCLACSGSVSLELMAHRKPTVIVYRIGWLTWLGQLLLVRARYITLVNLLASSQIHRTGWRAYDPDRADAEPIPFPEYLTTGDRSESMAGRVIQWLDDPDQYASVQRWLESLHQRYGETGASERAADRILEEIESRADAAHEDRGVAA